MSSAHGDAGFARVGDHRKRSRIVRGADREKRLLRFAVTAERSGPGFDRADAGPLDGCGPRRFGVDVGLHVFPTEFVSWRLRSVNAEAVLGQIAAVGRDQAELPGCACQPFGHGGDRMGDVVVPWPTRERQTAGDGERPTRIAERQSQFGRGHLNRRRKARVDVDQVDVVDPDARQARAPDGHRCVSPGTR